MLLICAEYLHIKHYLSMAEFPKEIRKKSLVLLTWPLDKTECGDSEQILKSEAMAIMQNLFLKTN